MMTPLRQETNFSFSNAGALWQHKYFFEGDFLFTENLHTTRVTFETIRVLSLSLIYGLQMHLYS